MISKMTIMSPDFNPTEQGKPLVYESFADSQAFETKTRSVSETVVPLETEDLSSANSIQALLNKFGGNFNNVDLSDGVKKYDKNATWLNKSGDRAFMVTQAQSTNGDVAPLSIGTFFVDKDNKWTPDTRVLVGKDGTAQLSVDGVSLQHNKSDTEIFLYPNSESRMKATFGMDQPANTTYISDEQIAAVISSVLSEVGGDTDNLRKPIARLKELGKKFLSRIIR